MIPPLFKGKYFMAFKPGFVNFMAGYASKAKLDASVLSEYSVLDTAFDYDSKISLGGGSNARSMGILVGKNGNLGTVIQYNGSQKMLGPKELPGLIESLSKKLTRLMASSSYTIQVYFSRNPDQSVNLVKDITRGARSVANAINLDLDTIFDEDERVLPNWLARENVYFVLWTDQMVLSQDEAKKSFDEESAKKKKNKILSKVLDFGLFDTQRPWFVSKRILDLHYSAVDGFVKDVNESISGVYNSSNDSSSFQILSAQDALKAIRRSIDPSSDISEWKPFLLFDRSDANWEKNNSVSSDKRLGRLLKEEGKNAPSTILAPRLDDQLFLEAGERVTSNICRIGGLYYSTYDMSLAPEETHDFSRLLSRMFGAQSKEFPWRVSFTFSGGERAGKALQGVFASMLKITTKNTNYNGNIISGLEDIGKLIKNNKPIANLRVAFTTWSPISEGLDKISEQGSAMARAVEGWGNVQVSDSSGDPVSSLMGTVLAIGKGGTAKIGSAPLEDVLMMLPWSRDSSPFKEGAILARTADGRPFPLEMASSQQTTFSEYIFGQPGSGKSVLLSLTNLGMCLSTRLLQNLDEDGLDLPIIRLIDIGFSAEGFYEVVKDALPKDKQHKIVYKSLSMTSDRLNPFDLPLGCRQPPPFLEGLITQLILQAATAPGATSLPAHMDELVTLLVQELYKKFSDKVSSGSRPKPYRRGVVEIDEGLERLGIEIPPTMPWYMVMDKLAFAGEIHLAHVAQRQAVPTLRDLATMDLKEVRQTFLNIRRLESGALLVDDLQVTLKTIVEKYPIISDVTNFNITDARISILDIQNVAGAGASADAVKQTSLMYMLAAIKQAGDFFVRPEMIIEYPKDYWFYHVPRIEKLFATPKRFMVDEAHRAGKSEAIQDLFDKFLREGRKFNILVTLASQRIDDINPKYFENISTVWVLSANNDAENIQKILKLSPTATEYVRSQLNGPSAKGAPFFIQMKMKTGVHEHYGYMTMGPQKIWAFSTTSEDVSLRNKLSVYLGPNEARKVLATLYPRGSAKDDISRRAADLAKEIAYQNNSSAENASKIIDQMVDECRAFHAAHLLKESGLTFTKPR